MSHLLVLPTAMTSVAADVAGIGSVVRSANQIAAGATTGLLAAAEDEVSAAIAALFSTHGQAYQHLSIQAAAVHEQFVRTLMASGDAYAAAEAATGARQLADGTGIVNNHEFYLASRDLMDRDPEAVAAILAAIGEVDEWVNANKDKVAAEFAPLIGIPVPILEVAVDRRTYGVSPITPEVVAQQQAIADVFFELGLIPKAIKIADAVVEPQS